MLAQKQPMLVRKEGLYLQDTAEKGRGVFCIHDIAAGETLEVTPALILDETATTHADKTILANYTFATGSVSKNLRQKLQLKSPANASSVVMGIQSFCNHSETPNAEIEWEERDGTVYHILKATRKIPKNTEICTSYGPEWFAEREGNI